MTGRRGIFLLRAYPGIDHITPVIYRTVTDHDVEADVVLPCDASFRWITGSNSSRTSTGPRSTT